MTISYNTLRVRVELSAITHNYRLLASMGGSLLPVVKADAYGHGLGPVSRALGDAGARTLCVGTVGEAGSLRDSGWLGGIISLLGPLDAADDLLLAEKDILPFVSNPAQLERLSRLGSELGRSLPVCLKFDTGMARLGFAAADMPALLALLARCPGVSPVMAASHLSSADELDQTDIVRAQGERFAAILAALRGAGHAVAGCLANSAAILAWPELHFEHQRPGVALYGTNPFLGTAWADKGAGFRQAMHVSTRVFAVHDLPRGGTVSYGCTYTAERDMRVAVVAAGYADGYSRGLTGKAEIALETARGLVRRPILGRVCMQLCIVDATDLELAPGATAWLLGGPEGLVPTDPAFISAEELAGWWGTITYEVFCILGLNPRYHVE